MAARLATGPVYESTGLESQDMDSNIDFGGGRGKLLLLLPREMMDGLLPCNATAQACVDCKGSRRLHAQMLSVAKDPTCAENERYSLSGDA